jgi:cell division protein FtsW (lipid II flippase)
MNDQFVVVGFLFVVGFFAFTLWVCRGPRKAIGKELLTRILVALFLISVLAAMFMAARGGAR